jgi:hypothetical protein
MLFPADSAFTASAREASGRSRPSSRAMPSPPLCLRRAMRRCAMRSLLLAGSRPDAADLRLAVIYTAARRSGMPQSLLETEATLRAKRRPLSNRGAESESRGRAPTIMAGRATAGIERIEPLAAENGRLRAAIKEAQEAIEKHSIANGVESPEASGALHLSPGRTSLLLPARRIVRGCRRVLHRSRPMSFRPLAS